MVQAFSITNYLGALWTAVPRTKPYHIRQWVFRSNPTLCPWPRRMLRHFKFSPLPSKSKCHWKSWRYVSANTQRNRFDLLRIIKGQTKSKINLKPFVWLCCDRKFLILGGPGCMWRFKRKSIGKYFFAFHLLRQVLRLHVAQTGLELTM